MKKKEEKRVGLLTIPKVFTHANKAFLPALQKLFFLFLVYIVLNSVDTILAYYYPNNTVWVLFNFVSLIVSSYLAINIMKHLSHPDANVHVTVGLVVKYTLFIFLFLGILLTSYLLLLMLGIFLLGIVSALTSINFNLSTLSNVVPFLIFPILLPLIYAVLFSQATYIYIVEKKGMWESLWMSKTYVRGHFFETLVRLLILLVPIVLLTFLSFATTYLRLGNVVNQYAIWPIVQSILHSLLFFYSLVWWYFVYKDIAKTSKEGGAVSRWFKWPVYTFGTIGVCFTVVFYVFLFFGKFK